VPGFSLARHATYIVATCMAISCINHRLGRSSISDFDGSAGSRADSVRGRSMVVVLEVIGVSLLLVRNPREAQPSPVIAVSRRNHMVYHMAMGRREVLVQLDDDLVERLDRLAEQYGTNRSELLRRGAAAVLEAAERAEADRVLQEAYRRLPQDPAIVSAARRLASLTTPEW
jgi:hypothetical protein